MKRYVCRFSCGASSAVATKLILAQLNPGDSAAIVNAFLAEEHPDNRRFLEDCERWFGQPIHVVRNEEFNASAREVFRRKRYMKGLRGAPCSKTLKREVLEAWQANTAQPGVLDIVVLGYDADEAARLDRFIDANPSTHVVAPLIEAKLGKADVLAMVQRAGIELPLMYRLGFHNANCIGCVKGGAGYWNKVRQHFPEAFEEMAQIEKSIGPGARLLRHRSGPLKGQRFYLHELDPTSGRYEDEPSIECGASCEMAEQEIRWGELA